MTFSAKRMYAIFQKDMKDLSKNMFISSSILMPIVLATLYGRMSDELPMEMVYLIINITFTMTATFTQCAIIAEEKEKNTLRGLMLSPASIPEILIGKSLVSFLLTMITIVLSSMLMGYRPENLIIITIAIIISSFFYIALGTILGLVTRSVVEASVVVLPVMLIFGLSSYMEMLIEKYSALSFINYLPSIQMVELATKVQEGAGLIDIWSYVLIIFAWVLAAILTTIIVFKRKQID